MESGRIQTRCTGRKHRRYCREVLEGSNWKKLSNAFPKEEEEEEHLDESKHVMSTWHFMYLMYLKIWRENLLQFQNGYDELIGFSNEDIDYVVDPNYIWINLFYTSGVYTVSVE